MWRQEDEYDLAYQNGTDIYRVKGVIVMDGSLTVYWLQGVRDLFEIEPTNIVFFSSFVVCS